MSYIRISILSAIAMSFISSVYASDESENSTNQPNDTIDYAVQPSVGLRAGQNDAAEAFGDLIIPLHGTSESIIFVNPRFSLLENEVEAGSLGIGYRKLFEEKGVLGANLYLDNQRSNSGGSFKKYGVGVEWLGKTIDARANWYGSDDQDRVVNEYETKESTVSQNTRTVSRNTTSNTIDTQQSVDVVEIGRGEITPTENRIKQDVTFATIQNTVTIAEERTTTVKERTTTRTDTTRVFEQFESVKEGWDAEIGAKLPNQTGPETRLFVGHFHYDEPYKANDTSGTKARLEMRFNNNITLDAEAYDQKIDDTSYFVGFRYAVPIQNPGIRNTNNSANSAHRNLKQRMVSETVQRDWRVRTDISDPIENIERRDVKVSKDRQRYTQVSTRTVQENTSVQNPDTFVEEEVLYDNITWVDQDSTVPADGKYEAPFTSVGEAAANAGENNTIFVCEAGGGVCDLQGGGGTYDEQSADHGINLQSGQILTSSIVLSNGDTFETQDRPILTNSIASNGPSGVISAIDTDNVVINRLDIRETSPNRLSAGINAFNAGNLTITNNIISSEGEESDALRVQDHAGGDVVIANNTFNVVSTGNTEAILLNRAPDASSTFLVENNDINVAGVNTSGIFTGNVAGEVTIRNNNISATGTQNGRAWGWRDFRGQNITFENNTITTDERSFGIHLRFAGDDTIDGATGTAEINITNNDITTGGSTRVPPRTDASAIYLDNTRGNTTINITGNNLQTEQDDAHGIRNRAPGAGVTVNQSGNTYNTTGANGLPYIVQ